MTGHQSSIQGELQGIIVQENLVSLGMTESSVLWSMSSQAGAATGGQIHSIMEGWLFSLLRVSFPLCCHFHYLALISSAT